MQDAKMQTTHYSAALMPTTLLQQVRSMAEGFTKWLAQNGLDPADVCMVYTGMSGIAYATAISLELCRSHNVIVNAAYVRKSNEDSHGSNIEFGAVGDGINFRLTPFKHVVFVDDFISTGATLRRCYKKCSEYRRPPCWGFDPFATPFGNRPTYEDAPFVGAIWSVLTRYQSQPQDPRAFDDTLASLEEPTPTPEA